MPTAIDRLYAEAVEVINILKNVPQLSLHVAAADHFRKALLLASASYFEQRISDCVLRFVSDRAKGSILVENFVRNQAVARRYHTWFKWDENNANQFFGMFGDEFKSIMKTKIAGSLDMQSAVKAFLEVGNERNKLVHQDYATFPMEKTLEEIYSLYLAALLFVEALPSELQNCDGRAPIIPEA